MKGSMGYREEKDFKLRNYEIELTGDQSPTLRPDNKESMHHMGGAAGESVYLYYEALLRFFKDGRLESVPTRVLSFGFGMGYNEILTVLFYLKNQRDLSQLRLFSYEKDTFLYALFNSWLQERGSSQSVFDDVFAGIQRVTLSFESQTLIHEVKASLRFLLENKLWMQNGPIHSVSDFAGPYDVVFYDAFSAKTNDYLWTEEFLGNFFSHHLSPRFVFSTYACTGVLKRVALASQSQFEKRAGFKGKRDSTMISRLAETLTPLPEI
ncbi:MAG: hypothetical protein JNL11_09075 [Bdellovibrionaceae bacterium]|nr:hypothetical protein [Pseudobdellovibrionaceae bacterium]